jgi:hypothetical protein
MRFTVIESKQEVTMSTMTTGETSKTHTTGGNRATPIQNMGYLDRIIRFALGVAMISVSATVLIVSSASPTWLEESTTMPVWPYVVALIGIIPLFTAILGWCPVYRLFGIKSCGGPNNPCGTLPYELYAATGNDPKPKTRSDHSLGNSEKENLNKLG